MKYNIYFLLFFALGLLGACRKGEEKPKGEPRGSDEYLMKRVGLSTFSSIHRETDGSTRKMRESEMSKKIKHEIKKKKGKKKRTA